LVCHHDEEPRCHFDSIEAERRSVDRKGRVTKVTTIHIIRRSGIASGYKGSPKSG
jgi:hypothetical protein